jgi:hypothetical protein
MALAAEADALLREIRAVRAARQLRLEQDLAEIERDYERDLRRMRKAVVTRRALVAAIASFGTITLLAVLCFS